MSERYKRFRIQAEFHLNHGEKHIIFPFTYNVDNNNMVNPSEILTRPSKYLESYFTGEMMSLIREHQYGADRLVITITKSIFRFDVYHFDGFRDMDYKHIKSIEMKLSEDEATNLVIKMLKDGLIHRDEWW